jgi:hypothetical protein
MLLPLDSHGGKRTFTSTVDAGRRSTKHNVDCYMYNRKIGDIHLSATDSFGSRFEDTGLLLLLTAVFSENSTQVFFDLLKSRVVYVLNPISS